MSSPLAITIKPDKDMVANYRRIAETDGKVKQFHKAISAAINRTLASMKTQAGREITQRFVIKKNDFTKEMHMTRATAAVPGGELLLKGPNIEAVKFKVKPDEPQSNRRQVVEQEDGTGKLEAPELPPITIQYKKSGGGEAPGKFVAVMGSGHKGVFGRESTKRLPIHQLSGPSVVGMLEVGGGEASQAIQQTAEETLHKRIEQEMKWFLGDK
ncbi:hypothetical protein FACS1894184_21110 [Clostridia bacterium]|nr:hypothetical protein FACS1894184_21110 [Clostridia bacterium]